MENIDTTKYTADTDYSGMSVEEITKVYDTIKAQLNYPWPLCRTKYVCVDVPHYQFKTFEDIIEGFNKLSKDFKEYEFLSLRPSCDSYDGDSIKLAITSLKTVDDIAEDIRAMFEYHEKESREEILQFEKLKAKYDK